jgi:glycosyltransferase involved in cell wall biosynthesis
MMAAPAPTARFSVIAAVHPLTTGAAPFNTAMVAALREQGPVDVISWRRMYPPLLYRAGQHDSVSRSCRRPDASFILDWHDPRTWRRALKRVSGYEPDALIVPWLHPVLAPQYRWLLQHAPRGTRRVVICHNVTPHESFRGAGVLTRAALRHSDLLVTHARHQRHELEALGLDGIPTLEAFHPRFVASDFAEHPSRAAVAAERRRQRDPGLLLLCFGAVRPYKGVDVALDALARVDPALSVRLIVAGRFWSGHALYRQQIARLGIADRVELRNRYVSNDEAALLFSAADAALLPYRSASQSGVVQLAFAHGCPVIATSVGGLPDAVQDGEDGMLCPADDPAALAEAIERMAGESARFKAAVRRHEESNSFERYAQLVADAIESGR